jgi:hypothetical protein
MKAEEYFILADKRERGKEDEGECSEHFKETDEEKEEGDS